MLILAQNPEVKVTMTRLVCDTQQPQDASTFPMSNSIGFAPYTIVLPLRPEVKDPGNSMSHSANTNCFHTPNMG